MALPTSGSISMAQIAGELGLSLPLDLNDSRVRALAGKPSGPISMPSDFYGKSAGPTVTIQITSSGTDTIGGGRRRDYFIATINWTGATTPSSYSWGWGGYSAALTAATSRTCRFNGQGYSPLNANGWDDAEPFCNVVIAGQTYTVVGPQMSLTADGNL